MKTFGVIIALTWAGLWLTPDQQGAGLFRRGEFIEAAGTFRDPMWQGLAWYRAAEFEKAAQAFSRRNTAEAFFNQGNAWLMRGKYEIAITCFDRALEKRPAWKEAVENRELAAARAERVKRTGGNEGGDMGEEEGQPDKLSFNQKPKNGGEEVETDSGEALSDQQIQALWLRRVQTRPADFLKAKFSHQQAMEQGGGK